MRFNVFLFVLLYVLGTSGHQGVHAGETEASAFAIQYTQSGKRDPFRALIGNNVRIKNVKFFKSIDEAVVEGILMDPKQGSVVIINGQVLKEGDFIGGFQIDAIEQNQVTMSRDGKTFEVPFNSSEEGSW